MLKLKTYLLSTAIISGLSLTAIADEPTIKAGGSVNFKAAKTNQKSYFETNKYSRENHFVTTTRLKVNADGALDNGLKYGGVIKLGDDTRTSAANGKIVSLRDTGVYLESSMGKVELGSMEGPSMTMKVDPVNFASGTGGTNGDYSDFINNGVGYVETAAGVRSPVAYITSPNTPLDTSTRSSTYNTLYNKITYYTPEVEGFQAGFSYSLDNGEIGGESSMSSKYFSGTGSPNHKNIFTLATTYKTQVDEFGIELGASGQYAHPEKVADSHPAANQVYRTLKAYHVGSVISYKEFKIGASFGDWFRSLNTKEQDQYNNADAIYYSLGLGYEKDDFTASITYFNSARMKSRFNALSFGADYTVAPGMMPYVEVTRFNFKPTATAYLTDTGSYAGEAKKNKGMQYLVGTKFEF